MSCCESVSGSADLGRTAIEGPPPHMRRRPSSSLLLGGGLLGGGSLLGGCGGGLGGGLLWCFLLDCHRYHLVVQRHTCLSPTGMNRPVPAPIDTKSFNIWKRNFVRNSLFFYRSDEISSGGSNEIKLRVIMHMINLIVSLYFSMLCRRGRDPFVSSSSHPDPIPRFDDHRAP
jgi:hypothetical protein